MPTTIDLLLDRDVPHHTPDQLHGLACALFEGEGAAHSAQEKPFTVWPLREERSGQVLRLTLLADYDQRGRPIPPKLRLGGRFFEVRRRRDEFVPFALLAQAPARTAAALSFETPTYFSRNGRDLPLPEPTLVFRSLASKWNLHASAELQINEQVIRGLLSSIVLNDADIRTVSTEAAHRARRTGFIGSASFAVVGQDPTAPGVFGALVRAAEYLGVGAQTTRGFGVALAGEC